jgi:hypothetical protein
MVLWEYILFEVYRVSRHDIDTFLLSDAPGVHCFVPQQLAEKLSANARWHGR